jgi:simple sugar transport system ATP-binding protein
LTGDDEAVTTTRPAAPVAAVRLEAIAKRFGDVVASDGATFEAGPGEIHALLGENGAGKTSLMNVLAGVYRPDAGTIRLDGQVVTIASPEVAKRLGVGMVHQEHRLVTRFTAPENIALGGFRPRWLTVGSAFRALAEELSTKFGMPIDANVPVWAMALGRRQRVELVKLLHHGARVIILDEPTATLAPSEVETLFGALRSLVDAGRTVIFITHKLDEVLRYTDRVTVMRAGKVCQTMPTAEATRDALNQLMVGEDRPTFGTVPANADPPDGPARTAEVGDPIAVVGDRNEGGSTVRCPERGRSVPATEEQVRIHWERRSRSDFAGTAPKNAPYDLGEIAQRDVILRLDRASVEDPTQAVNLTDASLEVRAGEVLGVAGIAGNGQAHLAGVIAGLVQLTSGSVHVGVRNLRGLTPRQVADLGVAYVPEDRREVGLVLDQSVAVNLALRRFDRPPLAKLGFIDRGQMRRDAVQLIARYGIRPPDPDVPAGQLSGGNQQRVVVARELSGQPRVIVVDNFTRGLDPRSTRQCIDEVWMHRDRGAAVIWITSDLSEALECDRVAVMNRGRIVAVLDRGEATRERVGLLMSEGIASGRGGEEPKGG